MCNYTTISKFSELSGYTVKAVQAKIHKNEWAEGVVWIKALDGRILISVAGYESWVETAAGAMLQPKIRSKSSSYTKTIAYCSDQPTQRQNGLQQINTSVPLDSVNINLGAFTSTCHVYPAPDAKIKVVLRGIPGLDRMELTIPAAFTEDEKELRAALTVLLFNASLAKSAYESMLV